MVNDFKDHEKIEKIEREVLKLYMINYTVTQTEEAHRSGEKKKKGIVGNTCINLTTVTYIFGLREITKKLHVSESRIRIMWSQSEAEHGN